MNLGSLRLLRVSFSVRPYWTRLIFISKTVAVTRYLAYQKSLAEFVTMQLPPTSPNLFLAQARSRYIQAAIVTFIPPLSHHLAHLPPNWFLTSEKSCDVSCRVMSFKESTTAILETSQEIALQILIVRVRQAPRTKNCMMSLFIWGLNLNSFLFALELFVKPARLARASRREHWHFSSVEIRTDWWVMKSLY